MRVYTPTLLAVIAITSIAWSQPELHLGGGIAFPTGPQSFTDGWKMGYDASGGIGFSLSPAVSLILTAGYATFPIDESGLIAKAGIPSGVAASVDGGSISGLDFAGNIKFSLMPKRVSLYVVTSAGYFSLSMSDATVTASYQGHSASTIVSRSTKSAFSTSFGAGIDVPVGETTSIFVESRYFIALYSDANTSYIPVRAGVRMSYTQF